VTLAVVALISVLVGALVASIIQVQMKTYNDMVNDKLEDLENRFTLHLNQVEDQVTELQAQQLELANAIATLSRVTDNLEIDNKDLKTSCFLSIDNSSSNKL